ncbi:unnamed protein product [Polarella glacialis]|uniref:Clathrin light chain n=1 Tax=Polarella glacialis TaxID=89957 RepID=A0A813KTW0_POLGL|nr:unnamed protein product [Polarella glacialis]
MEPADEPSLMAFTDAAPADAGSGMMDMGGAGDYQSPAAGASPMSFNMAGGDSPFGASENTSPTSFADPFQGVPTKESSNSIGKIPEMNALREWEDKHEADLEQFSREEQTKKQARRQVAAEQMTKWDGERVDGSKKRFATNRSNEQATESARADSLKPGANPWERVVDLIDTSARITTDESRDTSRMRALLIQLKSNPLVAAA